MIVKVDCEKPIEDVEDVNETCGNDVIIVINDKKMKKKFASLVKIQQMF